MLCLSMDTHDFGINYLFLLALFFQFFKADVQAAGGRAEKNQGGC